MEGCLSTTCTIPWYHCILGTCDAHFLFTTQFQSHRHPSKNANAAGEKVPLSQSSSPRESPVISIPCERKSRYLDRKKASPGGSQLPITIVVRRDGLDAFHGLGLDHKVGFLVIACWAAYSGGGDVCCCASPSCTAGATSSTSHTERERYC